MPIASVLGGYRRLCSGVYYADRNDVSITVWSPTLNVIWLPFFLLLAFITSLGVSLWLSAMYVQFRDIRHIVPFLTQIWLFATPIAYPSSLLSEPWRTLYGINPMVGVVEGFRWALLGTNTAPGPMIIVSSLVALAIVDFRGFLFPANGKNVCRCSLR